MAFCAVPSCKNTNIYRKISIFKAPSDHRRKEWIQFVQSEAEKLEKIMSPSDTHKKSQLKEFREVIGYRVLQICSEHFKNTDNLSLLPYQLGFA